MIDGLKNENFFYGADVVDAVDFARDIRVELVPGDMKRFMVAAPKPYTTIRPTDYFAPARADDTAFKRKEYDLYLDAGEPEYEIFRIGEKVRAWDLSGIRNFQHALAKEIGDRDQTLVRHPDTDNIYLLTTEARHYSMIKNKEFRGRAAVVVYGKPVTPKIIEVEK